MIYVRKLVLSEDVDQSMILLTSAPDIGVLVGISLTGLPFHWECGQTIVHNIGVEIYFNDELQ